MKIKKQAENGLQSRSSENGKIAMWHYGLKLQWYFIGDKAWRYGMVWFGIVWYGGGQITTEFVHEEISIMDYNRLSWTIIEGGDHDWDGWLAWITGTDDWHGWLSWMTGMDDWHGWLAWMTGMDDWHGWLAWMTILDYNLIYWWLTNWQTNGWTLLDVKSLSRLKIDAHYHVPKQLKINHTFIIPCIIPLIIHHHPSFILQLLSFSAYFLVPA